MDSSDAGRSDRPTRRRFLKLAAAALAAPAALAARPSRAEVAADIGAMVVVGFQGRSAGASAAKAMAAHIAAGRAGGAMLLGHNLGSRSDLLGLTALFHGAAGAAPLLAVDQEGGQVQRLSTRLGFARIPSARTVAGRMSPAEAEALYRAAGRELAAAGITLNLAPVADLHDAGNPVIGRHNRAFSADPAVVAAFAGAAIRGFSQGGVLTALKHFPGHGRSRGDSHTRVVDISRTWSEAERAPFAQLIRSGEAEIVMGGHLVLERFGSVPATWSREALLGDLRGALGFRGPIITDDLDMAGVRSIAGPREAALRAIEAGNDILLSSNTADYSADLPAVIGGWVADAVGEGRLTAARLAESAARIRSVKRLLA